MPEGWEICSIGDVSSLVQFGLSNSAETIGEYRFLRITDIQNNRVKWADVPFTNTDKAEAENYILDKGDILFARTGATVGKSFLITELPFVSVFASYLIRVKLLGVNHKYVKYFFESVNYWEQITDKSVGIGQPNVNGTKLKEILFPLPPLAEQRRIVSAIESAFAVIDKIEQNKTDLQTAIAAAKSKILSLAIRGKLVPQDPNDEPASVLLESIRAEREKLISEGKIKRGKGDSSIIRGDDSSYYQKVGDETVCIDDKTYFEIPDSWTWVRMGTIGDWGAGTTPLRTKTEYYGGRTLWLKTGELNNGYVYDSEEKITDLALKECSLRLNKIGDILIAMYGATIGKLAIVGKELTTNQACCACTPCNEVYNLFLFYYLLASKYTLIDLGSGGAQPNISRDKLIGFLMPLPPLAEQHRIVAAIETALKQLDNITSAFM